MSFTVVIISAVAILSVFALVGLGVTYNAFRVARHERKAADEAAGEERAARLKERVRRYVGPVDPKTALLTPPARVAVEFVGASCGFPGLGWMCSGSMFAGLLLICFGPAFAWGVYPVILAVSGHLLSSPYIVIEYLPGVAVTSAGALTYRELMLARHRRAERASGSVRPAGRWTPK
jgi:hypothetical protein